MYEDSSSTIGSEVSGSMEKDERSCEVNQCINVDRRNVLMRHRVVSSSVLC